MPEEKETVAVVTGSSSGIGFGRILLEFLIDKINESLIDNSQSEILIIPPSYIFTKSNDDEIDSGLITSRKSDYLGLSLDTCHVSDVRPNSHG